MLKLIINKNFLIININCFLNYNITNFINTILTFCQFFSNGNKEIIGKKEIKIKLCFQFSN